MAPFVLESEQTREAERWVSAATPVVRCKPWLGGGTGAGGVVMDAFWVFIASCGTVIFLSVVVLIISPSMKQYIFPLLTATQIILACVGIWALSKVF